MTEPRWPEGVTVTGPVAPEYRAVLTPAALNFVATLQRAFNPRRLELLQKRAERQLKIDRGDLPEFLPETAHIRADRNWRVAPIPPDLQRRHVEITGPTERKMLINALNSGADVFMADFEDANSPTWDNMLQGQINLREAIDRVIEVRTPEKTYRLNDKTALLLVRPRGWHLTEKHVLVDGQPISGSLFDFGLYFFHNAKRLLDKGSGPYFYLPKLESHLEARLWNDVFNLAQDELGLPRGTIKVTVLIETILAAFEMDEILWELRDYIVGLNCGRWDYIFSFIKKFSHRPDFVLPDRGQVTMTTHFLRSYAQLVIKTCHRRGAFAMGGMAAQIPIKGDEAANEAAIGKVRADKEREAGDGHDGTWVAHPGLVPVAKEVFDRLMPTPNNLHRLREDVVVTAADLLQVPQGSITEGGLRNNIDVSIRYMAAWLGGNGCVPIHNLMEDAATAEISRAQLWQWVHHQSRLADGRAVTLELVRGITREELGKIRAEVGEPAFATGHYEHAARLVDELTA